MDRGHMSSLELELVDSRLEKATDLANCDKKGHDPTGNREV